MSTAVTPASGAALHAFAAELYPICRSITGNGVRRTLDLIGDRIELQRHEVPSGTRVFDWEVPLEWNIDAAWVQDPHGRRVIDFANHNLHIVSYSEPVRTTLPLEELRSRIHTRPEHPDWIPYRTSYYRRNWGFCAQDDVVSRLKPGKYEVAVESSLEPGSLTYGECVIPGRTREEVLFFTHVCHPSLANDNTSGMSVASALASWIGSETRRFTYRFIFAPGTIGSLCWLKRNESRLGRVRHGLVLCLLGDPAPLTYKCSRRGTWEIDQVVPHVLERLEPQGRVIPFEPYGYDERQLCSPGFDLPVGRLTRSVNDGYAQYHSSADDLSLIAPETLERSLEALQEVVTVLEHNRCYVNVLPKGEPRLGKRGLYGATGGRSPADRERAMLWVLNQSDGEHSLVDISARSGLKFGEIRAVADELAGAKLLRDSAAPSGTRPRKAPKPKTLKSKTNKLRRAPAGRARRTGG